MLYLKAALLLIAGLSSAALLVIRNPEAMTVFLVCAAIWAFSRAYYFAFYVIEHYIDPSYRFSGLWALLGYLVRHRSR
jgi:hypothetical protein